MKKILFAVLALLLALPMAAVADDALTLSGAALNQAQIIRAEDSVSITEIITDADETYVTVLAHRVNDRQEEVFTLLDEDGTITQLLPDYGLRLASDSVNPETLVFMPGVLAETRENLRQQLALFDDEESYPFAAQPDGTLTAVMSYTIDGETLTETYTVAADTLALTEYAAAAADADGHVIETDQVQVLRGESDSFDLLFADADDGETFPLTLVSNTGAQITVLIPLNLAAVFSDGLDDILMFEDAAMTVPVSRFEPWTHEAAEGFTLYEGTEE